MTRLRWPAAIAGVCVVALVAAGGSAAAHRASPQARIDQMPGYHDVASSGGRLFTPGEDAVHSLTWNMGSGCDDPVQCTGTGQQKAQKFLSVAFNGPRAPISVAFQEMCFNTGYQELRFWMGALGYEYAFRADGTCGGSAGAFGIAVFWLGSCWGGTDSQCEILGNYANDVSGESKGYICGRAAFPGFIACSTHMTPNSASKAGLQIGEYYSDSALLNFLAPPVSSGDFNRDEYAPGFYSHSPPWREADLCIFDCHDTRGSQKLDYVFSVMCRTHLGTVFSMSPYSDHKMLQGFFSGSC